jgi:hypothetical protein
MKKRLLPILGFAFASCMGPASVVQFNEDDNLVQVFEDIPGTKDQLFLKANNWMIETFNDAESVIQHTDKEEGVVIGKYLMYGTVQTSAYGTADSRVYAVLDIRVKDNKTRLEIKPQGKWYYNASGLTIYGYSKEDAILEMEKLTESLYNALLKDNIEF